MKIRCPKCDVGLDIDPTKIPKKGAHATCPKCRARMFINAEAQARIVKTEKKKPAPKSQKVHKPEGTAYKIEGAPSPPAATAGKPAQKDEDAKAGKSTDVPPKPAPPLGAGPLPLGPDGEELEPAPWELDPDIEAPRVLAETGMEPKHIGMILIGVMVALFAVYVGWRYVSLSPDILNNPYSDQFAETIGQIKQRLSKTRQMTSSHRLYQVAGDSPEAALLAEIIGECDRGCSDIENATIYPMTPLNGFRAEVKCKVGMSIVNYNWMENTVLINDKPCE